MKNFVFIFIVFFIFVYSKTIYSLDIQNCSNIIIDGIEYNAQGICINDEYNNLNKIIITIIILILVNYFLINFIRKRLDVYHLVFNSLFIYSLIFSIFFIIWSLNNVNDSISYYSYALHHDYPIKLGAMVIANLNEVFINVLGLRYFEINFIYYFFNLLSLVIFSKIIHDPILNTKRPIDYIFYLFFIFSPSLNFWISGINKESITFLGLVGLILSYQNKRLFFSLIFLSLILIVRPYIFFILFFSYFIYIFIKSKKNFFTYLSISVLLLFSLYIMHYYRIPLRIPFDVFSVESILEFIYSRQSKVFEGGTLNYSMRESNFIYLLFSYLFRPSIFEVNNLFFMIIALDNLMLLLFVIYRLVICIKFKFQISSEIVFISLIFFILSLILLTITSNNLGIALRQKWMLIPFLIIILSNNKNKKIK